MRPHGYPTAGLIHDNGLDGAFLGGLLYGGFVFSGHFVDDDLGHVCAHAKDLGACITAEPTCRACVFNSDFHRVFPVCRFQ